MFLKQVMPALFTINLYPTPDCGDPPAIGGTAPGFHRYFENQHGDQWLFVWSPGERISRVYAGEFGWNTSLLVNLREQELRTPEGKSWHITLNAKRQRRSTLILDQMEALRLLACLEAMTARQRRTG